VRHRSDGGFTLVEVLVALVVVAIGLAALMVAVSGAARTSGYLRDKTLAQWIALNRLTEVRLTINKLAQGSIQSTGIQSQSSGISSSSTPSSSAQNNDTGELQFASRTWHYDTRYYDTTFQTTKRIVIRVWAGDAKTKGNPLAEATGFFGSGLSVPGNSNSLDWTVGSTAASANCRPQGAAAVNTPPQGSLGASGQPTTDMANCTPTSTTGAAAGTPVTSQPVPQ
jgi:type II secretion system protein I